MFVNGVELSLDMVPKEAGIAVDHNDGVQMEVVIRKNAPSRGTPGTPFRNVLSVARFIADCFDHSRVAVIHLNQP